MVMGGDEHAGYFLYSTHKLLHYYTVEFKVFQQKIHLFKFSQPNIIAVEKKLPILVSIVI